MRFILSRQELLDMIDRVCHKRLNISGEAWLVAYYAGKLDMDCVTSIGMANRDIAMLARLLREDS